MWATRPTRSPIRCQVSQMWATQPTIRPSRRWGTQICCGLDLAQPPLPAHEWGTQIGKIHGWATRPKSFLGLCVLSELRQNCLGDEVEDRC